MYSKDTITTKSYVLFQLYTLSKTEVGVKYQKYESVQKDHLQNLNSKRCLKMVREEKVSKK